MAVNRAEHVAFTINGNFHKVGADIGIGRSLNSYIRDIAKLSGTKFMCQTGICGACIVSITYKHPITKEDTTVAVNSCLFPVLRCHGMEVTTIEGLGNRKEGYHELTKRLALFNGTQCGYCSPAMSMAMYSKMKDMPELTMKDVENALDGNICRCTGYRPILDAYKSFATDVSDEIKGKFPDIEDYTICQKGSLQCSGNCAQYGCNPKSRIFSFCRIKSVNATDIQTTTWRPIRIGDKTEGLTPVWVITADLRQLFQVLDEIENDTYQLVAGNTASGLMNMPKASVMIDVSNIPELRNIQIDESVMTVGGNTTLSEFIRACEDSSKKYPNSFKYLEKMAEHFQLVANTSIRNIATLAGNLSMKHFSNDFQSDVFMMLAVINARIVIAENLNEETTMDLFHYLNYDMKKKIIKCLILPSLDQGWILQSYKIMPRSRNSYALVNAAFLFKCDLGDDCRVIEPPRILFGGVRKSLVRAEITEEYLFGKQLKDKTVFDQSLMLLDSEIQSHNESGSMEYSTESKIKMALSLFYKFVLSLDQDRLDERLRSGGQIISHPVSRGTQEYHLAPSMDPEKPLYKPIAKLESLIQTSGEADYTGDKETSPDQLFAALVTTNIACATIKSIDSSRAKAMPGVVAFFSAEDIPGQNRYTLDNELFMPVKEELFCSGDVNFAGQPVGVIVAKSQREANDAAREVKIDYDIVRTPLLSIRDVLESGTEEKIILRHVYAPEGSNRYENHDGDLKEIDGEWELGEQMHYSIEPQTCVCEPKSRGIHIVAATQWMENIHICVAKLLNIKQSSITMETPRLGGGFGGKITKSSIPACACALAAHKLNRPIKMVMDVETVLKVIGKRCAVFGKYKALVANDGGIRSLKADIYIDKGFSQNDPVCFMALSALKYTYHSEAWEINIYDVLTDKVCSSWMRAPGTLESFSLIEVLMENIASELGLSPLDVRNVNLKHAELKEMIDDVKESADYESRVIKVHEYNQNNRWTKKGLSLVPLVFPLWYLGNQHSTVSIYSDGSVNISHGGVEMGQGMNTRVAQVCAYSLGIDIHLIRISAPSNVMSPNNCFTGASISTSGVATATLKCCEQLLERLKPIIESLNDQNDWFEMVKKAHEKGMNLKASYMWTAEGDPLPKDYEVLGVGVSEVLLDILTGQHRILRTDICVDAGESLNPDLDVGQMEGAFIMGLGYLTSERILHNRSNGQLITINALNYLPPAVKDIPEDFRVSLRKNSSNPLGLLRSKAIGEPPLCLSISVVFALRDAIQATLSERAQEKLWQSLYPPYTVEKLFMASNISSDSFILDESTHL